MDVDLAALDWIPFMADVLYLGCEGNAVFVYPKWMDAVCFVNCFPLFVVHFAV